MENLKIIIEFSEHGEGVIRANQEGVPEILMQKIRDDISKNFQGSYMDERTRCSINAAIDSYLQHLQQSGFLKKVILDEWFVTDELPDM